LEAIRSSSGLPIITGPGGTAQNCIPSTAITSGRGSPNPASTFPASARSIAGKRPPAMIETSRGFNRRR